MTWLPLDMTSKSERGTAEQKSKTDDHKTSFCPTTNPKHFGKLHVRNYNNLHVALVIPCIIVDIIIGFNQLLSREIALMVDEQILNFGSSSLYKQVI
jgi:hypothetical protein